MAATDELAQKLQRRADINEGEMESSPSSNVFNPYTEFKEFTRKQIIDLQKTFNKYDLKKDKFIDFDELKYMMEKLGVPQTHLGLKEMIQEVDEDQDNRISFREFLLIFRKAAAGELNVDSGLYELYQNISEIDVDVEGVKGAKGFFEAKIGQLSASQKFEDEIKQEQEERKVQAEDKKERRKDFKNKANFFEKQTY